MARKSRPSKWQKIFSLQNSIIILVIAIISISTFFLIHNIETYDYIVETNAFFAPFEYYEDRKIIGVDIDIINRVAKKLDAKIEIKNVEFDLIIDNVASGIIADAGAAGLTITPARAEKVNFSIPYYTSVQYVIFRKDNAPETREEHIVWEALSGRTLGSQMGGTGYLFMSDETENGVLKDTNTKIKGFDSHQLAADAINAHIIDYAIADELAAQFIVDKNPNLDAMPLYYMGDATSEDYPVEESYAIAVNKQCPELLNTFNEVLTEMLQPNLDGKSEIDLLILKYMGFDNKESSTNEIINEEEFYNATY